MRDTRRATSRRLAQRLLVAGAVVVGLVAAAIVHQHDHLAVIHDALATIGTGMRGGTAALVTSRYVGL